MDDRSMQAAIQGAVATGRAELAQLDQLVDDLSDGLAETRPAGPALSTAAQQVDELSRQLIRDLRQHLDRERDSLGSFNIAFFGRTGAGKSTLLSAFGELDGEYVSPGASDWTTDVHYVEWNGCRLFDTPGINGWGRASESSACEAVTCVFM